MCHAIIVHALHLTLSSSNCGVKLQKKRGRAVPKLILLLHMTPALSPKHPCCLHRQRHCKPSSDSQAKRRNNCSLWTKQHFEKREKQYECVNVK
jgi:hypothetical protein